MSTETATLSWAHRLAGWALALEPTGDDLALARRALIDTVACALAAGQDPIMDVTGPLTDVARWTTLAHVLDYDDVHMESTSHVSAVCVPAVLAASGDARAYLAGAGVMARLGRALGWNHYVRGWHATCTAGAPAAAVAAAVSWGLSAEQTTHALLLGIPAAGGVQNAFGTQGKSLQVGFAADAGVRAARLAAAGAQAAPSALNQWMGLLGADADDLDLSGPAVPGGLAIKLAPCCYALQRPIHAARLLSQQGIPLPEVEAIDVIAPRSTVQPLIPSRPETGLQGKFSLEYGVAATLLEPDPGLATFTDEAVRRPEARRLLELVRFTPVGPGDGILSGTTRIEVRVRDGRRFLAEVTLPPGAPDLPPTDEQFRIKLAGCRPDLPDLPDVLAGLDWSSAAGVLDTYLPR